MIVHINVHKNKNMLETILKNPEHSITFKHTCERPEIQDVNVFNSIWKFCLQHLLKKNIFIPKLYEHGSSKSAYL